MKNTIKILSAICLIVFTCSFQSAPKILVHNGSMAVPGKIGYVNINGLGPSKECYQNLDSCYLETSCNVSGDDLGNQHYDCAAWESPTGSYYRAVEVDGHYEWVLDKKATAAVKKETEDAEKERLVLLKKFSTQRLSVAELERVYKMGDGLLMPMNKLSTDLATIDKQLQRLWIHQIIMQLDKEPR